MSRIPKTAPQLQAIVSERLQALREVAEGGSVIEVPVPLGHSPDASGANWDMGTFDGDVLDHVPAIRAIVSAARQEFELVADPAGESHTFAEEAERQQDA